MLKATIYLNDVVFSGIDDSATDDTPPAALSKGFHNYMHSAGRDVLAWGGEPKVIESHANLTGYVKRIFDRMRDGSLHGGTLRIEIEDSKR